MTAWTDPELYEREHADDPAFGLPFWSEVVRAVDPRRMLEPACRTGRLTIPLARLGVAAKLVGVDRGEPFLKRLRTRLAGERSTAGARSERCSRPAAGSRSPPAPTSCPRRCSRARRCAWTATIRPLTTV